MERDLYMCSSFPWQNQFLAPGSINGLCAATTVSMGDDLNGPREILHAS